MADIQPKGIVGPSKLNPWRNKWMSPIPGVSFRDMWGGITGRNDYDPAGARLDQTQANTERDLALESRGRQDLLGGQLQAQIRGLGPSVAAQQAKFGIAEAMRNASTQAANARGVNRGMALRESLYAGQNAQEAANRDAAMMRASEQLGAMGQYGQLQSQQRAGDIQSRQVSLDAEKANQQAELQRQGYQTQLANENAARKQKGFGSLMNAAGGIVGALSDINAKENIAPMQSGSFAERMMAQRLADANVLQQRADAESNARIEAALAGSNAGYGAQQAGTQSNAVNGASVAGAPDSGGGISGMLGGAMQQFGGGLMSDAKSKERIAFLESQLYSDRPLRKLDPENPYHPDYLSAAERAVENGFDSNATGSPDITWNGDGTYSRRADSRDNLRGVRPYSYRYRPEYAEFIADQASTGSNAPSVAHAMAYGDARIPRVGVMAQELEKTPGGRKVVRETPVGKMLDEKRSIAFALANQADMNQRLAALERLNRKAR